MAGLILGGQLAVTKAVNIAAAFGLSSKLIGLTLIAVGTSLPELVTSAVAAKKGNTDIAIGNIVGSNIFNIFLILALTGVLSPLEYKIELNADLGILLTASLMLFFTMFTGKKRSLDRWEAVLFLVMYAGYTIFLIYRN